MTMGYAWRPLTCSVGLAMLKPAADGAVSPTET
jgi:hypothetical protein